MADSSSTHVADEKKKATTRETTVNDFPGDNMIEE